MPLKIAVFVGSLRTGSYNRQLAKALTRLPHASEHEFIFADIGALPHYNQDDDGDQAAPVKAMKALVAASDGVLFVTPEYNRSVPGVLKNAIDHGSRPYGESCWTGKPAGMLGVSIGAIGTALAQQHLRNILAYLDMPTVGQPEVYLRWSDELLTEGGTVGEEARRFLDDWMKSFLKLVEVHQLQE